MSNSAHENFNWGILGPGGIARAFAKDLGFSQGHAIAAVGSRSLENAQKFADTFGGTLLTEATKNWLQIQQWMQSMSQRRTQHTMTMSFWRSMPESQCCAKNLLR
jgi:shikimate 5-dehydrogenase